MKKHHFSNTFKFLAISIMIICPFHNYLEAQGDALIMPGKGVGVLKLGDRIDVINRKIGNIKVDNSRKVVNPTSGDEMWLSYKNLGMTFVFNYETKKLEKIVVLTVGLLVENTGISVGSSESDVKKFLKEPDENSKEGELDYPRLGINFYIKKENKKVYAIEVKKRKLL